MAALKIRERCRQEKLTNASIDTQGLKFYKLQGNLQIEIIVYNGVRLQ